MNFITSFIKKINADTNKQYVLKYNESNINDYNIFQNLPQINTNIDNVNEVKKNITTEENIHKISLFELCCSSQLISSFCILLTFFFIRIGLLHDKMLSKINHFNERYQQEYSYLNDSPNSPLLISICASEVKMGRFNQYIEKKKAFTKRKKEIIKSAEITVKYQKYVEKIAIMNGFIFTILYLCIVFCLEVFVNKIYLNDLYTVYYKLLCNFILLGIFFILVYSISLPQSISFDVIDKPYSNEEVNLNSIRSRNSSLTDLKEAIENLQKQSDKNKKLPPAINRLRKNFTRARSETNCNIYKNLKINTQINKYKSKVNLDEINIDENNDKMATLETVKKKIQIRIKEDNYNLNQYLIKSLVLAICIIALACHLSSYVINSILLINKVLFIIILLILFTIVASMLYYQLKLQYTIKNELLWYKMDQKNEEKEDNLSATSSQAEDKKFLFQEENENNNQDISLNNNIETVSNIEIEYEHEDNNDIIQGRKSFDNIKLKKV